MYKVEIFRATVERMLLYGSESWILTSLLTKRLAGTYTKLLRAALNIHLSDHQRNVNVYGNIPKISETIRKRRLSLAGHCWRSNEIVKDLLFWEPTRGKRCKDRPEKTYIHHLTENTDMNQQDLKKKPWKTDKNGKMSYHQNRTKRQKELMQIIHVAYVVKTSLKTFGQYNAQTVYFGYTELV